MTAEQLDALTKMGDELTAVEECLESMRLEQRTDTSLRVVKLGLTALPAQNEMR